MNADELLRHYERIADAPEAVARLRRFVLDLAVRGKLVPQDPRDEPASELLKKIAAEKVGLVSGRKVNASATSSSFVSSVSELPCPTGWSIASLQAICTSITDGDHLPPPKSEAGIPFLVIGNVREQRIDFAGCRHVAREYYEKLDPIRRPRTGDLLYTLVGSYGIPVVVSDDRPFCVQRHIGILRPSKLLVLRFLARVLESQIAFDQATGCATGIAQKTVPLSGLRRMAIPLPPVAEQHRIVAKVDELMALCDRLEAARAQREAARDRLARSCLARLDTPDTETFREDVRFALDALPALTARPDQIKQLRQTILNLAVRGRLVAQDPIDESAAELLRRLAAAKVDRKRRTGDSRINQAPDADAGELPLALPAGWSVQSFENLFLFIDYRGNTPPKTRDGIPLITAKNVRMGSLNREPREFISPDTFQKWMTRGFPEIGDLFFTTEAPLANVCLNDIAEPFALAQRVICLQPYAPINTRFIMFALMSDLMQALVDDQATGLTAKGIKAAKLKHLPLPVPPLAEQQRIVAKVNELMAMCDRLEARLTQAHGHRRRLLEALLYQALEPATALEEQAA